MTMRGHWFDIPGVTNGARTLQEQMLGLQPALDEAPGKAVADLGCAEGMISLEFAKAGAKSIYACDCNAEMIKTARELVGNASVMFERKDLNDMIAGEAKQYDIVLALAIIHKLRDPAEATRFIADSARSLVVVRLPYGSRGAFKSKSAPHAQCDTHEVFRDRGFELERTVEGPRRELLNYWRRT